MGPPHPNPKARARDSPILGSLCTLYSQTTRPRCSELGMITLLVEMHVLVGPSCVTIRQRGPKFFCGTILWKATEYDSDQILQGDQARKMKCTYGVYHALQLQGQGPSTPTSLGSIYVGPYIFFDSNSNQIWYGPNAWNRAQAQIYTLPVKLCLKQLMHRQQIWPDNLWWWIA